jgi:hypothetical protein
LGDLAGEIVQPPIEVTKTRPIGERHDGRDDWCNQIRKPDQAEQKPKTIHAVAPARTRDILASSGEED